MALRHHPPFRERRLETRELEERVALVGQKSVGLAARKAKRTAAIPARPLTP
jgi:hypothetical protein